MSVRTRFAPSPTGYLHIGGVRTALFNWLFARQHDGQFVVRIDDTDQQRNVEQAIEPILNGFRWLDLDWDEGPQVGGDYGPYYQSQRGDKYQAAVDALLDCGAAYYDFATTDELQSERDAARATGQPFTYSRRWMARSDEDIARYESEGRQGVVRLKMPRSGQLTLHDMVRGDVTFEYAREQDHVIQRADGSCLYHLATVVDDHDMRITHVIRAEEHLSNTPRQVFIFQQLGHEAPQFAHLPYVAEPGSKNKLSKRKLDKYLKNREFAELNRHGQAIAARLGLPVAADTFNPVLVDFYRQVGYLPQALLNYLLLLGWSLDDKTEEFDRAAMIQQFSLDRVNNSPASFDPQKLWAFQDRAMQQLPVKQKVAQVVPFLRATGLVGDPPACDTAPYVTKILNAAGDRIKVAGDILDYDDFFTADDELTYDEKAWAKRIRKPSEAVELLRAYEQELPAVDPFSSATLESHLHQFAATREIRISQIIHALRVAVTGKAVGFGMFDTLAILGRDRCVARLDRAIRLAADK